MLICPVSIVQITGTILANLNVQYSWNSWKWMHLDLMVFPFFCYIEVQENTIYKSIAIYTIYVDTVNTR